MAVGDTPPLLPCRLLRAPPLHLRLCLGSLALRLGVAAVLRLPCLSVPPVALRSGPQARLPCSSLTDHPAHPHWPLHPCRTMAPTPFSPNMESTAAAAVSATRAPLLHAPLRCTNTSAPSSTGDPVGVIIALSARQQPHTRGRAEHGVWG